MNMDKAWTTALQLIAEIDSFRGIMRRLTPFLACTVVFAWAENPPAITVLEQRCLGCHTSKLKKSGLDLSTRDLALRGGDRGPAILPGKSKESLLIQVASHATKPHMPFGSLKLSDAELTVLAAWIDAGASYGEASTVSATAEPASPLPDHWSFRVPVR